jgi:hypothetical protein
VTFVATWSSKTPLRRLALGAIVVDVVLIAIRVSSYRELLAMPGSVRFIAKPLSVLVLYLAAATWMTSQISGLRAVALSLASSFGLLTAAVQIIHLWIESFVTREGSLTAITTLSFNAWDVSPLGCGGLRHQANGSIRTIGGNGR